MYRCRLAHFLVLIACVDCYCAVSLLRIKTNTKEPPEDQERGEVAKTFSGLYVGGTLQKSSLRGGRGGGGMLCHPLPCYSTALVHPVDDRWTGEDMPFSPPVGDEVERHPPLLLPSVDSHRCTVYSMRIILAVLQKRAHYLCFIFTRRAGGIAFCLIVSSGPPHPVPRGRRRTAWSPLVAVLDGKGLSRPVERDFPMFSRGP